MHRVASPTTNYRPDIDGLRSIAVLSVIFFHADFTWARGGFSGVDVFFVISGYLITGIIRRELNAGTFSFARFYERRARRILPVLLLVIAATLGVCTLLVLPRDRPPISRSAIAVLLFSANIMFWRGADFGELTLVNYFGRRIHEQPLVHTWSLGVEEQYYLLFPLMVFLVWRLRRSWVLPALIAGFVASFVFSVWATPRSPGVSFYLLPARGWELLAGGLVNWLPSSSAWTSRRRELAAFVGLALILIAAVVYTSATPFPGYAAALPVTGAVLLLHFAPGTRTGRFLAWQPLVFVGLISYSAYLWHQPLFSLAFYVSLDGHIDTSAALLLCAATLLLATLSWRYVETPFRDATAVPRRRLAATLAAATVAIAIPASMTAFASDYGRRTPIATNVVVESLISMFSDCTIMSETRAIGVGCLTDPNSKRSPSFLVFGDSHADSLFPSFIRLSRDTGLQGRLLDRAACSPLLEVTAVPTSPPVCLQGRERALQMVTDDHIGSVFLVSRFSFDYGKRNTFEERLEKTIDAFAQRGAVVYLVAQVPEQPFYLRRAYLRAVLMQRFLGIDATPIIAAMTPSREEHARQQAFVREAFARYRDDARVRIIDVSEVLCGTGACLLGTTEEPYYYDEHHLSGAGALLVAPEIARQFALSRPQ